MNPNSANQLWSRWVFTVVESGRHVPRAEVELNAARWLRKGFGSVGRVRVSPTATGWRIEAVVESAAAHDPAFVRRVRHQWQSNFVARGWGLYAWGGVGARVLAGSQQDGEPGSQWVELPSVIGR